MSTFDNTNRGAIFKNNNKKEDKHPDYRGTINVDGVEKEISLWIKTSKDGKQFFSASISEPFKKTEDKMKLSYGIMDKPNPDSDLPF